MDDYELDPADKEAHLLELKDEIVETDWNGSISGFDFPPDMPYELRVIRDNQKQREAETAFQLAAADPASDLSQFDPSIFATTAEFSGARRPRFHPDNDHDDDREEENIRRRERDE
jgi:hypothetical protein